jgi:hypothetical protein
VPAAEGGPWVEVSRLGNPLVNEVVIGLPDKDKFNGTEPANDVANFATYVEYPTLPAVIDIVFGTSFQPQVFPRTDLVEAFLTGIPGVNSFPASNNPVPAEYIHLNTNTEALVDTILNITTAAPSPAGSQSRLGAAGCVVQGALAPTTVGCDPFGFPNGRRPVDDVVDLALDVVEGYLLTPSATTNPENYTLLTDGVDQAATHFDATFPYLTTPTQGANGNGT